MGLLEITAMPVDNNNNNIENDNKKDWNAYNRKKSLQFSHDIQHKWENGATAKDSLSIVIII